MAIYKTETQSVEKWRGDNDLNIVIAYRGLFDKKVVPTSGVPSDDTKVSWSGQSGSGEIIFHDEGRGFTGWVQYQVRGEEKLPYRGELKV